MEHETMRTSLYMEKDKYREIKVYCASKGITVNGLIKALLDKYMQEVVKNGSQL